RHAFSSSRNDYSHRAAKISIFPLMLDASRADLVAGVAGSGTMGRGIVQVLAQCGARTLVFDAQPGAARKARESIGETLGKLAERGKLQRGAVDAALRRI